MPALAAKRFDYLVPSSMAGRVGVGTRVRVVLQGRRVGGWVTAADVEPPASVTLRPLAGVSGCGPPAAVIELAEWAAWRWAGPESSFLRTASPERVVRALPRPPEMPEITAGGLPAGMAEVRRAPRGHALVLRLPPADDLLPLVLEVLAVASQERPGPASAPHSGVPGSVVVLAPSAGWAARLADRLSRRGVPVAASWAEAAAGWPVVVGSRAAAWAPVPRLRAAVVLDAHDEAYREERAPTFNAWEVVTERARREGALCVLTSPCPTVVQGSRCRVVAPDRAHERGGWPAVVVVDRRGADPRTGVLSPELVELGRSVVEAGERFVCVLHRTGRARLLACTGCGEVARCERCGRPCAQDGELLRCPGCGNARPVVCASCGATRLRVLRPGTSRVREELAALLRVPVAEVAGPPTAPVDGPGVGDAPAVVGTEAALHRVRRAGAVAFVDFDQHLLAPRFAAAEEALALLARAGRLVGGRRRRAAGDDRPRRATVLVQTRAPDHEVLVAAVRGDPAHLVAGEAAVRRELALPPTSALALVSGAAGPAFAASVAEVGGSRSVAVADLGDGRWLVRGSDHRRLCDALAAAPRPKGRLRVEVDPTAV